MASLILDDQFSYAPVASSPIGHGYTEVRGGSNFAITSGKILSTTTPNYSLISNPLLRPADGTENPRDQMVSVTIPHGTAGANIVLRSDGTTLNGYQFVGAVGSGAGQIQASSGGTPSNPAGGGFATYSDPDSSDWIVTFGVRGASPSSLIAKVAKASAPDVALQTWTVASDGTANLQVAGRMGPALQDTTNQVNRIRTYNYSDGVFPTFSTLPAAGKATVTGIDAAGVHLSAPAASGGTETGFTYQWHRSQTPAFTPSGATAIAGATGLTLADNAAPSNGQMTYWKIVATDSASNVGVGIEAGAVAPNAAGFRVAFLGTSFETLKPTLASFQGNAAYAGTPGAYSPASAFAALFADGMIDGKVRAVTYFNGAQSGSFSGDWTSTANGSYWDTLKAGFQGIGAQAGDVVNVCLGLNDLWNNVAAATYGANIQTIVDNIKAAGWKACLDYPPYVIPGTNNNLWNQQHHAVLPLYNAQLDAIAAADPANVKIGVREWWGFANNPDFYFPDNGHPDDRGVFLHGGLKARAHYNNYIATPTGGRVSRIPAPRRGR